MWIFLYQFAGERENKLLMVAAYESLRLILALALRAKVSRAARDSFLFNRVAARFASRAFRAARDKEIGGEILVASRANSFS